MSENNEIIPAGEESNAATEAKVDNSLSDWIPTSVSKWFEKPLIANDENNATIESKVDNSLSAWIPASVSQWLEQLQISKYHTQSGHGFAAEDVNILSDRLKGKTVEVTGLSNAANGSDRISSGIAIQTKYCQSASDTIYAAFGKDGVYRYSGQLLEVPKDQYADCVDLMKKRITDGRVPGFSNPSDAEKLVKQGEVTYKQARNIARAGNIDSFSFDAKTQAVTSSYVFAASFAIQFAARVWSGDSVKAALSDAVKMALTASSSAFAIGLITAQLLRTQLATAGNIAVQSGIKALYQLPIFKSGITSLASFSLGKEVGGMAAVNHVGKLARTNVLTGTVATAITATPDLYRAAVLQNISWTQFGKNLAVNASSVAGGTGGWVAGAATGAAVASIVPGMGTVVGGVVGGIAGAIGGSYVASSTAKNLVDQVADDDEIILLNETQETAAEVAYDFLLTDAEIVELGGKLKTLMTPEWGKEIWQKTSSSEERKQLIYADIDTLCLSIVQKRPMICLPSPDQVENEIIDVACTFAKPI